MQANNLVPQIWVDALLASHLSTANSMHLALQFDKADEWLREYCVTEREIALGMIRALGYEAVFRDGAYQLEGK